MDMDLDGDAFEAEAYDCNDPTNEPRPDSVVYTEIFRDLRKHNKEATQLLREPLLNSKFQNVITHGLKQEITKRTKEDFPDTVTLAVVGDMQAGMYRPVPRSGTILITSRQKLCYQLDLEHWHDCPQGTPHNLYNNSLR